MYNIRFLINYIIMYLINPYYILKLSYMSNKSKIFEYIIMKEIKTLQESLYGKRTTIFSDTNY